MPDLNRRIRLIIVGPVTIDGDGRSVPGAVVTDESIWCQRQDLGSSEDLTADGTGTVVTAFANFVVRYREDLITTPDTRIAVIDEHGREHYVRRVQEVGERRRYLTIECGHTTG